MIKTAPPVNINEVQTGYTEGRKIASFYTQANVTNQVMGLITLTTVPKDVKTNDLHMQETAYGVLVSNSKGSMLVPWTNIRNVVYK